MRKKRKQYSPEFKAQVALTAAKGNETIAEIAARYEVAPSQIMAWKKELIERAGEIFSGGKKTPQDDSEPSVGQLYQQIGQLKVERDFLAKGLGILRSKKNEP
jgi:transposase